MFVIRRPKKIIYDISFSLNNFLDHGLREKTEQEQKLLNVVPGRKKNYDRSFK